MTGRIAAKVANEEDHDKFILMHTMGANIVSVIG
jgi:Na+-transporting methylmalonyl-CoA/oxaloacetate decarboxylase beta subunit